MCQRSKVDCAEESLGRQICLLLLLKLLKVIMSIGIPIKLLHEAEGHIITLETTTGEVYRGKLLEAEDNMNCQMLNITLTARDGRVTQVEQVFIRGSMIRFFILPDMLKNAPMFKVKPGGRSAPKPPIHMGRGGKNQLDLVASCGEKDRFWFLVLIKAHHHMGV